MPYLFGLIGQPIVPRVQSGGGALEEILDAFRRDRPHFAKGGHFDRPGMLRRPTLQGATRWARSEGRGHLNTVGENLELCGEPYIFRVAG